MRKTHIYNDHMRVVIALRSILKPQLRSTNFMIHPQAINLVLIGGEQRADLISQVGHPQGHHLM